VQVRGLIAGNGGRAFLLDGSAMAARSGRTIGTHRPVAGGRDRQ